MDVTIKDVARIADVSIATVSRVLNGTKAVSPEVTERVLAVIEQTGFKRNAAARSLVMKKSHMIGVIITDISNMYFGELVKGIDAMAHYYNYNIILTNSNREEKREAEFINILMEKGVDGIIFTANKRVKEDVEELIAGSSIPFISLNTGSKNAVNVRVDNFKESYEATKYIINLGHKNIGHISGSSDDAVSLLRTEGYKQALKDSGIQFKPSWISEGSFSFKSGYEAMEKMLLYNKELTAVFSASDEMAFGAITCIQDRGMKVPEDISIMGFDNIQYTEYVRPKLTTVRQPIREIGEVSVKTLIRLINGETIEERNIYLGGGIVIRDSVRQI